MATFGFPFCIILQLIPLILEFTNYYQSEETTIPDKSKVKLDLYQMLDQRNLFIHLHFTLILAVFLFFLFFLLASNFSQNFHVYNVLFLHIWKHFKRSFKDLLPASTYKLTGYIQRSK